MRFNIDVQLDDEEREAAAAAARKLVDEIQTGDATESELLTRLTMGTLHSLTESEAGPGAIFAAVITALEVGRELGRRGIDATVQAEVEDGLGAVDDFLRGLADDKPSPKHRDFGSEE